MMEEQKEQVMTIMMTREMMEEQKEQVMTIMMTREREMRMMAKAEMKIPERHRGTNIKVTREAPTKMMRCSRSVPDSGGSVRQGFCRRSDTHFWTSLCCVSFFINNARYCSATSSSSTY